MFTTGVFDKGGKMMQVEALIATMNQQDDTILSKMNIQTDAVVVNQCDRFDWAEYKKDGHRIRFLSAAERGIGLSRNTALMRAKGDICLFSDDDLVYCDGYAKMLQEAFHALPQADVIVFNIQSMGDRKKRRQIKRMCRVRWYNFMRYGAARMAVRRARILQKNISFSLLFGGGTVYSSGEDTIFLHDCLKSGLKIYAVPILLAAIDDSGSTWFQGYNEKFLADRGALNSAMYGLGAVTQNVLYLLRHRRVYRENHGMLPSLRLMQRGSRQYRKNKREDFHTEW